MIASTTREQRRYGQDGGGGNDDDDDDNDNDDRRLASRRRSRSSSQVQFDEHSDQVRSTATAAAAIRESEIERVQVGARETRARCWSTNCLQEERNGANRHRAEQSSDSESLEIRSERKQKEKQSSDWRPGYKKQQEAAHDRLVRANKLAAGSKGNQVASVVSRPPQRLQAQPSDRATTVAPAATSAAGHQQSGALASGSALDSSEGVGEQKVVASDKARRASTGARGRGSGAAPAAGVQKRIGLLEALLGDRGKSWFEHKTVILDIQNGKQQQQRSNESGDKSCESEQVNANLSNNFAATHQAAAARETSKKTGQQQSIESDKKQQQQHQVSTATTTTTANNNKNLKYSRLPTFGSVPQKLVANSKQLLSQSQQLNLHAPSVPYFSYQGHARNIDITQRKQKTTPTTSGGAKSQTFSRDKFRFRRTSDADGSLVSGRLSRTSSSSGGGGGSNNSSSNNSRGQLLQTSSSLSASSSDSTNGHQGCSRLLNSYSKSSRNSHKRADTAAAAAARNNSIARQVSASTSSLQQLAGSASGAKHLTPSAPPRSAVSRKAPSSSPLGYSNISNLFPSQSVRLWRPASRQSKQTAAEAAANTNHRTRYKSASLLNLSDTPQGKFSPTSLSARPTSQVQASVRSQQAAAATTTTTTATSRKSTRVTGRNSVASSTDKMRRQAPTGASGGGGSSSNQQLATSMGSLNQNQSLRRDFGTKLRPMSATGGNYMAPQGTNSTRQRSASSAGGGGGAYHRLGSAGMSPLIDPDCPVHGDHLGPQQQQSAPMYGLGRGRYSSQAIDSEQDEFARTRYGGGGGGGPGAASSRGYHSASQPDLYDSNETSAGRHAQYYDDPYNIARPTYGGGGGGGGGGTERTSGAYKSSPIYSPVSPIDNNYDNYQNRNQHHHNQWANEAGQQRYDKTGARLNSGESGGATPYYNNVSRFSMYHQAGDGNIGSSLAPPSEQLRRILGYKPSSVPPKPVHLHPQWAYTRPFIHLQPAGSGFGRSPTPPLGDPENGDYFIDEATGLHQDVPKFAPLNRLQDNQAIRAVDFHPSGEVYAIGSNSRALRICAYPAEHELRHFDPFDTASGGGGGGESGTGWQPKPPRVLFKFLQVHRGSIYCVSFNPSGQLLATGSNDQTIHIVKYNSITHNPDGEEFRLTMHNGTIRDLCFIDDSSGNGSSLLLSGGGGDNKIYVTDCDTITPFQSMAGHTQMVMALNHCGGAQFVSGSADKTIRFWDLRSRACTSIVSAPPPTHGSPTPTSSGSGSGPGAPVCALRVDPSGRLLASGHTDTTCMLYDIRGGKIIQTFAPHDDEIRAISFSPKSYYLLTGGYDGRLVVSDLQGDLSQPLPSVCVARSQDKIVQAKWHPADFTFVSTSADKSATLWSLPGEIHN